ncbi:MAG: hypothetical protein HY721_24855 [Planctomycetes bacterium]|nr:hypothetical protein [Planctomycetota bacterium]
MVEQEAYALLTTSDLVRLLIKEIATAHGLEPLAISFNDALGVIREAIVEIRAVRAQSLPQTYRRLLRDIAACVQHRRNHPPLYPQVVKTHGSSFALKHWNQKAIRRDFDPELRILGAPA